MQYLGISSELFLTLLAALGGALVVMYLARLRRRRIQVPYSALWARIIAKATTRSFWHRIKRSLSLLLQLTVLLCIMLALRDPRPVEEEVEGRHVIIMVDTSASMATRDLPGGRDRMEAAREAAVAVFDQLGAEDQVMLVRVDGELRPLTPFVRPDAITRQLLETLDYSATSADLVAALQFAARSLEGRPRPELILITDGALDDDTALAIAAVDLPPNTEASVVRTASRDRLDNVAITAFNVRRYPANRMNYEVFVQVRNLAEHQATVQLSLRANDRLVERAMLNLEPGETAVHWLDNIPTGGRRLEAEIEVVAGDVLDLFPLDDVAYALLPERRQLRVQLVGQPSLFVEAPLRMNRNLEVSRWWSESEYVASLSDSQRAYDVTVFNAVAPPLPETGGFLFIRPSGESSPWSNRGRVIDPIVDRVSRSEPLSRWISRDQWQDIQIPSALRLRATDDDVVAVRAIRDDPMVIRRETDGRRMVGLAFGIDESDFALRVAYPLFVLNALDWLTNQGGELISSYTTGRAWPLELEGEGVNQIEVAQLNAPNGRTETVDVVGGRLTLYPEFPGFHEFRWINANGTQGSHLVAANLANALESQVSSRSDLPFDELDLATADDEVQDSMLWTSQDPWFYLVIVAIALLCFEWFTYNRRITV